jgi:hypothetical protein
MDSLFCLVVELAFEFFDEAISGAFVFFGRSMRDAFLTGSSTGSLLGRSPWWQS